MKIRFFLATLLLAALLPAWAQHGGGTGPSPLGGGGGGAPSFPLLAPDGLITAPSYSFTTEPTAGLRVDSNDDLYVQGANNTGTNAIGEDVYITGGLGTGTGAPGAIYFYTGTTGTSGTTPQALGYRGLWSEESFDAYLEDSTSFDAAEIFANADQSGRPYAGFYVYEDGTGQTAGVQASITGGGDWVQVYYEDNEIWAGPNGILLQTDTGTKPTCASGVRGNVWVAKGGVGVADAPEICLKNSSDTYAWYALATVP